jgi:hypothetical protein
VTSSEFLKKVFPDLKIEVRSTLQIYTQEKTYMLAWKFDATVV